MKKSLITILKERKHRKRKKPLNNRHTIVIFEKMHILTFKFYFPKIFLCFGVTGKSQSEILTFKYSEKLNKDLTS